jgi:hypothetical protein
MPACGKHGSSFGVATTSRWFTDVAKRSGSDGSTEGGDWCALRRGRIRGGAELGGACLSCPQNRDGLSNVIRRTRQAGPSDLTSQAGPSEVTSQAGPSEVTSQAGPSEGPRSADRPPSKAPTHCLARGCFQTTSRTQNPGKSVILNLLG